MKFSVGFASVLAASAGRKNDDDRHVGLNKEGEAGDDNHTPKWRLDQLLGFVQELFDDEAFDDNAPKVLQRAKRIYGGTEDEKGMFEKNAEKMLATYKDCKKSYFNKDNYFGGPNQEASEELGFDHFPTRTNERKRRSTGAWEDTDVDGNEMTEIRLTRGDPQLMTKEITTGFRKWAKRYIGHCGGQWKFRHHFHRMHKWNRNLQKKYINNGFTHEDGVTDFSDKWYVKPKWLEAPYENRQDSWKVHDPASMDQYIHSFSDSGDKWMNAFEPELDESEAKKYGGWHKQKVNFPDYNDDDVEA
jgi:hypothetical protein